MNHTELFRTYLHHYANKNLEAISAMLAEEVHLRDWNISVFGKAEAIRETAKSFAEAESIAIHILALYESTDTVAAEVHIVVNETIELYVVDVIAFDVHGKIKAIRSYKGRGSKFNRKRNAIETGTDPGDGRGVLHCEGEIFVYESGALFE